MYTKRVMLQLMARVALASECGLRTRTLQTTMNKKQMLQFYTMAMRQWHDDDTNIFQIVARHVSVFNIFDVWISFYSLYLTRCPMEENQVKMTRNQVLVIDRLSTYRWSWWSWWCMNGHSKRTHLLPFKLSLMTSATEGINKFSLALSSKPHCFKGYALYRLCGRLVDKYLHAKAIKWRT